MVEGSICVGTLLLSHSTQSLYWSYSYCVPCELVIVLLQVVIEALVGVDAQSLNGTITSNSSELSNLEKEIASKSNPNPNTKVKNGSVSPKGSTPTLDRMNL